ncbi:hypothetical protein C2E23DRAFT_884583 [Lenzites betulinus]|nr:hypothetical protein C2E23DRAFT_884583 [Lenzites betulinus]
MRIPSFAQLNSFIRRVLGLPMPSVLDALFDAPVKNATLPVDIALQLYITGSIANLNGTLPPYASGPGNGGWPNVTVLSELKAERSYDPSDGNPVKNASADAFRTSTQSSSSTLSSSPSLTAMSNRDPIPAHDTITFSPHSDSGDKLLFGYRFDEASAPSLLDLLVAATTLHSHSPDYILLSRQCYWFAGMLLRVLLGDTDVDPEVNPGAQDTLFAPAFVPSSTDTALDTQPVLVGRAGTFKRLFQITTRQEIDVLYRSEIKQAYQTKYDEVNERLEAPRRQAEEVARQAEEIAREVEAARAREEALQKDAARAHEDTARAREDTARAREETARVAEAARVREEALQKEAARQAEEIARLREQLARPERQGAPPHA